MFNGLAVLPDPPGIAVGWYATGEAYAGTRQNDQTWIAVQKVSQRAEMFRLKIHTRSIRALAARG